MNGFRAIRIAAAAAGVATLLLLTASPAAAASAVFEQATTPIEDVVDDVTETVEDGVDDVTEPVEDTVDDVADTIDDVADPVEDAVDEVVEDVVDDLVQDVTDTVNDTTDSVKNAVGDVAKSVDDPVGAVDGVGGKVGASLGGPNKGPSPSSPDHRGDAPSQGPIGEEGAMHSEEESLLRGSDATSTFTPDSAVSTQPDPDSSLLEEIGSAIADAAKRLAFPLALVTVVAAFLAIQGFFDRKDPKLTLAPVDSQQGYIAFK